MLLEDGVEDGGESVGTRANRPGGSIPPRFLFTRSIALLFVQSYLKVHSPLALMLLIPGNMICLALERRNAI